MPRGYTSRMAQDLKAQLHDRLVTAIRTALGDSCPERVDPLLAPAKNPEHGDFQSNAAMGLAKQVGMKPRDVAERIVEVVDLAGIADEPMIAGPGFINIRFTPDALAHAASDLDDDTLGIAPAGTEAMNIVVDLCGVNLAKQMHVGHIRATVIGDAIARLHERLGNNVTRQNHFGDWGLPIAMVTDRIRTKEAAGELNLDSLTVQDLEVHYRCAKVACDEGRAEWVAIEHHALGPKAEAEWEDAYARGSEALSSAKATLVALQAGDKDTIAIWERISQITLDACMETCARMQATVTPAATAGESSYRDQLAGIVDTLVSSGAAEESEGALIVRLDDIGIEQPCLIRKSDGGFLYATFDLAAIRHRVDVLKARRVYYAVDVRQSLHFKQVFGAAIKGGLTQTANGVDAELIHASFGTILGTDNKPFKSRSGDTVKLSDLLDESIERARSAVNEKNPDLDPDEREAIANDVAIAAIKYADLSSDRVKDYVFDFDTIIAFEGATGPYLQYANVRVKSILRRAHENGITEWTSAPIVADAPEERALILALLGYPDVVRTSADLAEPHRLCNYTYELANAFSSFFSACPVLKADDASLVQSRLRLTSLVGRVLQDALTCLGIPTPERM